MASTNIRLKKVFLVFIFLVFSGSIKAQVDSLLLGMEDTSSQQLLPEKMGFVKKAFWGEHGLMRTLKISPLTAEGRQKELRVRHTMLKVHQFMGIATVAGMLTTIYYGQQIKSGNYKFIKRKDVAAGITVSCYTITGLMQLLAPPPLIIRKSTGGWSSIKVHRTLAYVHFTGMMVTPLLGIYLHNHGYDLITYHQVSAYVTTAALATAMIVMTF
jgi:hypothetical protein